MIHKIKHPYQTEVLLPLTAVDNNIDFLWCRIKDTKVEFSDGRICQLKSMQTIHALTEDFDKLLQRIYGRRQKQELEHFLKKWYRALDGHLMSLEFIYIETHEHAEPVNPA